MKTLRIATCFVFGISLYVAQIAELQGQIFAAQNPQAVQQASAEFVSESEGEVQQSIWPKITLPKITMPKITMPKVTMPDMSKVFSPVNAGYKKVTSGTKQAWEGTKEMFSFGNKDTTAAQYSSTQPKPSFWQKLISRDEPAAPQTVGEWMSQPRLDH